MNATTVAVDLAKSVFQVTEADDQWRILRTHRVMEACGSAHHQARWLAGLGIQVMLLPPKHVRRYVLGNKTDAADCAALLQACRNLKAA